MSKPKIKRVYHPYNVWEEFHCGLWRVLEKDDEDEYLRKAISFTGNAELYGEYMKKAIVQWPISCEHNLSCRGMNRQAWIGHAAACIATGSPEYITRMAWRHLTKEQQDAANLKADEAIAEWEDFYIRSLEDAKDKIRD